MVHASERAVKDRDGGNIAEAGGRDVSRDAGSLRDVAARRRKKTVHMVHGFFKSGRGERIRTSGLYVPNVALYQAKLHPDFCFFDSAVFVKNRCVVTSKNVTITMFFLKGNTLVKKFFETRYRLLFAARLRLPRRRV
ncbi:hypothetical protein BLAT2472_90030 [Burkholderia latens]